MGYNSTNVYRVWNPRTNKVIVTQDVVFNKHQVFSSDIQELKDNLLHAETDKLVKQLLRDQEPQEKHHINQADKKELETPSEIIEDKAEEEIRDEIIVAVDYRKELKKQNAERDSEKEPEPYVTPPQTPQPAALLAAAIRQAEREELEIREETSGEQFAS